jgi:hypothetical protein
MANLDAILRISAKGDATGLAGLSAGIKGIQKAGEQANSALGGMGKILGSVTGGVLALGAGLSAAGVVAFAKGAIDAADNMRDLSQKTGVSVENLSRFQQAAEKSGTNIDEVGKAMIKLGKNMYEAAATGSGPAASALREIGLSATDASGRLVPADEQMLRITERLSQIPDAGRRSALAIDLMGKSATNLVPMFMEGRQAIEGLNATISTEFANKADAYNDSLAATKAVFGQIGMAIADQLLPYLSGAVDWISKVGIGFRDYIVANQEPIRQTIETIGGIGKSLGPWVIGLGLVVGAYKLLTEAVKAAAIAQAALAALSGPSGWAKLALAAGATAAAVWGINEATKRTGASTTAAALEAEKLAAGMAGAKTEAEGVVPPIENAKQLQAAFTAAIEQSNTQYQRLVDTAKATSQTFELDMKLLNSRFTAEQAINSTAKELLKIKLTQATTDAQKIAIIGQIMKLELEAARLQKDAAISQSEAEVTIADLKRRSAWAELRKADAALATARAMNQGTAEERKREEQRIATLEAGLEVAKQAANAADREFVMTGKIADERNRAINAQFRLTEFQARNSAREAEEQARRAVNQVQAITELNPSGGSVGGQQYRTTRTAAGGSITELLPAFAGGGYTGNAPRSGGLDGQGGFMAMLHPRETVIDHSRASGGGVPNITIRTGEVVQMPDGSQWVSMADLEQAMQATAAGVLGQLRTPAGRIAMGGA